MHASQYHINTLKEAPTEAEVASHQLMTRAGMIRKAAGGIYTYMPMGLRVLRKIENIIRQEMDRSGAIELLMPVVQPAELWVESGRWEKYGDELLRIKDRHQRDFVLQPTSEEVITDIARNEIHSWRQLPINFYHIQTQIPEPFRARTFEELQVVGVIYDPPGVGVLVIYANIKPGLGVPLVIKHVVRKRVYVGGRGRPKASPAWRPYSVARRSTLT